MEHLQSNFPRNLATSSRAFFLTMLFVCLMGSAHAENKKAEEAIIIEVSPLAMMVTRGHDVHVSYDVPKDVIVTFNGLPANIRDLRAGMMVTVRPDATGKLALAIRAHNAPRYK